MSGKTPTEEPIWYGVQVEGERGPEWFRPRDRMSALMVLHLLENRRGMLVRRGKGGRWEPVPGEQAKK